MQVNVPDVACQMYTPVSFNHFDHRYGSPVDQPYNIHSGSVVTSHISQPIYTEPDYQDFGHALLRVDDRLSLDVHIRRVADDLPAHSHRIKNSPPESPLDRLLLDFVAERRQQAARGMSMEELLGPPYPSFEALLSDTKPTTTFHPLTEVLTDILRTFPDLSTLPEKVGVLYIMFLLMRWQICPTRENYDRLPEWFSPRASQLFEAHPAWVDQVPFPRMRDQLVREYLQYPFEDFFLPYTLGISVSWPYEAMDTLLEIPGTGSEGKPPRLAIDPVFERHIRNLANWKLGTPFTKAISGLAESAKGEMGRGRE